MAAKLPPDLWSHVLSFVSPFEWHSLFYSHPTFRPLVLYHERIIISKHRRFIHDEDWVTYERCGKLPKHVAAFVFGFGHLLDDPRIHAADKFTLVQSKSPYDPLLMRVCRYVESPVTDLGAMDLTPRVLCAEHGVVLEETDLGLTVTGPGLEGFCVHGVIWEGRVYWTPYARKTTVELFNTPPRA